MNKQELITSISEKSELTKKDSEKALKAIVETIQETLANNDEVNVLGLGKFSTVDVAEKSGVSKLQGDEKEWTTPAHRKPKFKAGSELKSIINK